MKTDITIVGGGLAGSMAAALLGRAGRNVIVVDPHEVVPTDFRCEKLEHGHIDLLAETGLADQVIESATRTDMLWIARFGRLVDKMPFTQYAMAYEGLVGSMRRQIPATVPIVRCWATGFQTSPDRQTIQLSNGDTIETRLVILATGLNWSLRESLGVERELVSPCHSITIGFNLKRVDGADFAFPALQYNPEGIGNRVAYITLFHIGSTLRANLFLYQPLKSPLVAAFRTDPDAALRRLLPGLARLIGETVVQGPMKVRPTDLYRMRHVEQPGVVMIGDAFATPCPATGTGTLKVFNDVSQLCNRYIPEWLASPGMGVDKIAAFYADPIKTASDTVAIEKAFALRRISTDPSRYWALQRWLRFVVRLGRWTMRSMTSTPRHVVDRVPVGAETRAIARPDGAATQV
ncbi:FAD-dependent oxidoreductase [Lichenihabitans psoromatis]|uniref:FAD-dependent oxidoreductase n=1 Tax=Lichenihabitans psoromatis TaxID=2528642 RepID=UPI001FDF264C|nr:NAD(P)/FAD-dependent oxidoreductase [Lichenihabitans psoromatis]